MTSEPNFSDSALPQADASQSVPGIGGKAEDGGIIAISDRRFWLLNLLWIPHALVILLLIANYTVDLPSIDQWDGELPFLEKVAKGTATFSDLIAPQLEHRVATNRVIGWFVATFFGWNHKVECGFVWLLACGCAWNLCILSCRQPGRSLAARILQLTLMAMLLFGVAQYASWTNCFSIQWFCIEWYLLTGLVVAGASWKFAVRFGVCLALALVATYSSSNGMLLWVLFPPVLFAPLSRDHLRTQGRFVAMWAGVALLAIGGYFVGYQRSDGAGPSMLEGLQDPVRFVTFFLANVGSPFSRGGGFDPINQAVVAGAIVVTLALAALGYLFLRRSDARLLELTMPWMVLGAYAMITGGAMTLGRAASGVSEAIASRYVNTHVLSAIALTFLVPVVVRHMVYSRGAGNSGGRWWRWMGAVTEGKAAGFMASLSTAAVLVHLSYSVVIFDLYPFNKRMFSGVKAAVLFVPCFADESLLKWAWTKPVSKMLPQVEFLDRQGYLRPGLIRSAKIRELIGSGDARLGRPGQNGSIEQVNRPAQNVVVLSGWAAFAGKGEPAGAVVLSWETNPDDATVFAIAQAGPHRDDIAERLRNPKYRWAGWTKAFDTNALPKGNLTIRAWAFDTDTGKVVELNGSFPINTR